MSLVGQQFGAYRLLQLIKSGDKSEIYLAECSGPTRQAIVTVIPLDTARYPHTHQIQAIRDAFRQEASRAMSASHPFLNPLLFYGDEARGSCIYCYLVSTAWSDGTLDTYLKRSTALLEPEDIVRIVEQISNVLDWLHNQRLLHGEIKPSNIVVRRSDRQHIYEVSLDGLASTRCINAMFSQAAIRGNPTYLAPEQWSASPTTASDQYALAVLAYKLLTGQAPFQGTLEQIKQQHCFMQPQPPSALNGKLPPTVDAPLLRALAKAPGKRHRSIADFSQALNQAILPKNHVKQVRLAKSSRARANYSSGASGLTEWKASLVLFLLCIGLFGFIASVVLNTYGLLPPLVALIATSIGGIVTALASGWVVFQKLFSWAIWTKAKHWLVVVISLCIIGALAAGAIFWTLYSPSLDPYTHQGQLAFTDPLTNNSLKHGWPEIQTSSNSTGQCAFQNGSYHVHITTPKNMFSCISESDTSEFTNFVYEVQMVLVSGNCGGIIFRANIMMGNRYTFLLCGNDKNIFYDLNTYTNNAGPQSLDNGTFVLDPTKPVQIAVIAHTNNITIYVNKQQIMTKQDKTFDAGHIGVAASDINSNTEVAFSNVRVWSLNT